MTPEEMQDRDIVEFTDDSGNTLMLEVMDYFYYNGQEFAALCDAQENPSDDEPDDDPVYIMQVNTFEEQSLENPNERRAGFSASARRTNLSAHAGSPAARRRAHDPGIASAL